MSKCDVRVEMESDQRVFKIGDNVHFTVHVSVSDKVTCKGLIASLGWYTHGRGNIDRDSTAQRVLFKGTWQPGEYSYPCTLEVTDGPMTYHGHYVNLDWEVSAAADIPWAFDPNDSVEIVVEPDPDNPAKTEPDKPIDTSDKYASIPFPVKLIGPLIPLSIGSGFLYFSDDWMDIFNILFGSIFILVGIIFLVSIINSALTRKKLGDVKVQIKPDCIRPGDTINTTISFVAQSDISVNNMMAVLTATEIAVSGSGTNRTTHKHKLHKSEHVIANTSQFSTHMPIHRNTKISIPDDAAFSLDAGDNSIVWELAFHIDIDNWPDWKRLVQISIDY